MQTNDLFQLVKSLERSEKRFFRLSASIHEGSKNYLRLLDALEGMDIYDEEELRKRLKGERFLSNLSYEKNYLFNLILKCLRNYYSGDTVETRIRETIRDAQILFGKGLYGASRKTLQRARKAAYRHEKYVMALEVISLANRLMSAERYEGMSEKNLNALYKEESELLKRIGEAGRNWHLISPFFLYSYKTGTIRDAAYIRSFEKKLKPLLAGGGKRLSYEMKSDLYNACGVCYFSLGNYPKAYEYIRKRKDLIESVPGRIHEDIDSYTATLYNYLLCLRFLERYDEFMPVVNLLKSLHPRSLKERIHAFENACMMELNYYLHTCRFEKGIALIPEIEEKLRQFGDKVTGEMRVVYYYDFAYLFMLTGDYARSLKWVNKILMLKPTDIRQDLHSFSLLLRMILHFELGNNDLLEYFVRSAYRFLNKKKLLFRFEAALLKFIGSKLPRITGRAMMIESFKLLKGEMEGILRDPFERRALEYFDFNSWLEAKISGKPFVDVVREKAAGKRST